MCSDCGDPNCDRSLADAELLAERLRKETELSKETRMRESVTVDEAIELLNSAAARDMEAAVALVETRVPCNQALRDHPTIQVAIDEGQIPTVGLLGILNGLFGVDEKGWGPITAVLDKDRVTGEYTKVSFRRTEHK